MFHPQKLQQAAAWAKTAREHSLQEKQASNAANYVTNQRLYDKPYEPVTHYSVMSPLERQHAARYFNLRQQTDRMMPEHKYQQLFGGGRTPAAPSPLPPLPAGSYNPVEHYPHVPTKTRARAARYFQNRQKYDKMTPVRKSPGAKPKPSPAPAAK